MSQPFSPSSNPLSRLSIFIVVVLVLGSLALGTTMVRSNYNTGVDDPIAQPIAFSHQHHVQGLGLDCRFCHTSVERAAQAGYPDTHTCMTCHSEIWKNAQMLAPVRESARLQKPLSWKRVYRLPDYVHFNHGIHVTKGVGCVTCHGDVEHMPVIKQTRTFMMKDCVSCHQEPEKFLGTLVVSQFHIHAQPLTDCNRCHQ